MPPRRRKSSRCPRSKPRKNSRRNIKGGDDDTDVKEINKAIDAYIKRNPIFTEFKEECHTYVNNVFTYIKDPANTAEVQANKEKFEQLILRLLEDKSESTLNLWNKFSKEKKILEKWKTTRETKPNKKNTQLGGAGLQEAGERMEAFDEGMEGLELAIGTAIRLAGMYVLTESGYKRLLYASMVVGGGGMMGGAVGFVVPLIIFGATEGWRREQEWGQRPPRQGGHP